MDLVNLIIFLSSAALLKLLTIPLTSLTVKLIALLFKVSLQLLTQGRVLHCPSDDWGSVKMLPPISLIFKWAGLFQGIAFVYFRVDLDGFLGNIRDFSLEECHLE